MSKKKDVYAVILAGGSGTRFWPMSRQSNPKQFLDMTGEGSLLQLTVRRLLSSVEKENILIITNALHQRQIKQQLAAFKIPSRHILLEPEGKNTAPAIGWAAAFIHAQNPNAVMGIFPSDHLILNQKEFVKVFALAVSAARHNHLVTLGIQPTRPETGYGYLKIAKDRHDKTPGVFKVECFTEKPSLNKARQFLKARNYLWNSGMFIWKTDVILEAFKKHLPQTYCFFERYHGASVPAELWKKLSSVSIDYGILEKASDVVAVPAQHLQWSDLGSFESLAEILPKDKEGNIRRGDVIALNCRRSFIWGQKRLVAGVGLDGLIVVDTPDALLICQHDSSQQVRDVVTQLKHSGRREV